VGYREVVKGAELERTRDKNENRDPICPWNNRHLSENKAVLNLMALCLSAKVPRQTKRNYALSMPGHILTLQVPFIFGLSRLFSHFKRLTKGIVSE